MVDGIGPEMGKKGTALRQAIAAGRPNVAELKAALAFMRLPQESDENSTPDSYMRVVSYCAFDPDYSVTPPNVVAVSYGITGGCAIGEVQFHHPLNLMVDPAGANMPALSFAGEDCQSASREAASYANIFFYGASFDGPKEQLIRAADLLLRGEAVKLAGFPKFKGLCDCRRLSLGIAAANLPDGRRLAAISVPAWVRCSKDVSQ
jgi:hypothetical protein